MDKCVVVVCDSFYQKNVLSTTRPNLLQSLMSISYPLIKYMFQTSSYDLRGVQKSLLIRSHSAVFTILNSPKDLAQFCVSLTVTRHIIFIPLTYNYVHYYAIWKGIDRLV